MQKIFKNRKHAGQLLGDLLFRKLKNDIPVILGIPRGGVVVGYYVAQYFKTTITAIVSKKLPYPEHKEVAFGAICEDLSVFVKPEVALSPKVIMEAIEQQMDELERRITTFRPTKSLPELAGNTVIIIDDGIATGATIIPALQLCKKRSPGKVIVAVPISGPRAFPEIYNLADEVIALVTPESFTSVSQFYEDFEELNDDQVKRFIV